MIINCLLDANYACIRALVLVCTLTKYNYLLLGSLVDGLPYIGRCDH